MSSVFLVDHQQSQELLRQIVDARVPIILSYMSKNKWHVAKAVMTDCDEQRLSVETLYPATARQPLNVRVGQPMGVSFKHAYGKFVFDSIIEDFHPSTDPRKGGMLVLQAPTHMEAIQRRSYFRVNVPETLRVNVVMWHRSGKMMPEDYTPTCTQGRLIDLSAGGAQVAITGSGSQNPFEAGAQCDFRKGQFIGVRFSPLPYEPPLTFNAQIRNILPTADGRAACLGLQIVGLEATAEGKDTLIRIADVVERYYQINQTGQDVAAITAQGATPGPG